MLRVIVLSAFTFSMIFGTAPCLSAADGRRTDIHLFGGDITMGAPLAPWYRSIGITDVWLYPVRGAFPQDQDPGTQLSVNDLQVAGTLASYRENDIRHWWMERPVPDYFHLTAKQAGVDLWTSTAAADALWDNVCDNIASIYPQVNNAGFTGLVFDMESYYTGGDVLYGQTDQYGINGGYYRRGLQIGEAIQNAWSNAKAIAVYGFGYEGEKWWYQGLKDAGLDLYVGAEHTYGAGCNELGNEWYQSWWGGMSTKQTCDWKRTQFPFIADNQHVNAGLFPIDFTANQPNYLATYFREQLASAANDDPNGPIPVWLWPQGGFSQETWNNVNYASGDTAESYLSALRDYSSAFAIPEPRSSVLVTCVGISLLYRMFSGVCMKRLFYCMRSPACGTVGE